jgi:hypothetical protein
MRLGGNGARVSSAPLALSAFRLHYSIFAPSLALLQVRA